jgi:V/A-type H+-transporting ATPase subunit E
MNEANALREEMLKKGKQEAQTEKNRILSQARLDTRKRVLEAKERQMQKVLGEAASVLDSPDTIPAYADVMRRIATEACAAIGGETLVIRTDGAGSAALKPVLGKIEKDIDAQTGVKTSLSLANEGVNGVVVVSASGVIVDNTFATRLERRKRDIRKELAAILFG